MKCKRCNFYPVHKAQGYYAELGLCLRALLRLDCRRKGT